MTHYGNRFSKEIELANGYALQVEGTCGYYSLVVYKGTEPVYNNDGFGTVEGAIADGEEWIKNNDDEA